MVSAAIVMFLPVVLVTKFAPESNFTSGTPTFVLVVDPVKLMLPVCAVTVLLR